VPTYQYACTECGHAFDQFQSFSDDALTQCPECDGRLRKLFNAVGVVFKGSGFYRTDSRTDARAGASASTPAANGSSGSEKSSSTEKSSGSEKSSPSSDSKPSPAPAGASGSAKGSGKSGAKD
jgi:putative FmdB family regulatory protein